MHATSLRIFCIVWSATGPQIDLCTCTSYNFCSNPEFYEDEVEASDTLAVKDVMLKAELNGRVPLLGAKNAGCICIMLSSSNGFLSDMPL
jgi:hypothetical protein